MDARDLDPARLPAALADLHASLPVGASVELLVGNGWDPAHLDDIVVGAGFTPLTLGRDHTPLTLAREHTLPDRVGAGMRVLVCGLNPSVYSADAGIGFARPGNRFWPAALAAGLVTRDRDPGHALAVDRVGMTDLVKRATPRADALTADEYAAGTARVARLAAWLAPAVVLVVGLAGWRTAVDRRAVPGPQEATLGGRPVYVMPSTSGLNASSRLPDLTDHMRRALRLAPPPPAATSGRQRGARSRTA